MLLLDPQGVPGGQTKGGLRKFFTYLLRRHREKVREEALQSTAKASNAFLINGNLDSIFQRNNISCSCYKILTTLFFYRLESHGIIPSKGNTEDKMFTVLQQDFQSYW